MSSILVLALCVTLSSCETSNAQQVHRYATARQSVSNASFERRLAVSPRGTKEQLLYRYAYTASYIKTQET